MPGKASPVLHVGVMCLQLLPHGAQLFEDARHHFFQGWKVAAVGLARLDRQLLGRADPGHNVLTLRIHQELAVEVVCPV